jgi:hypothetical protein
MAEAAARFDFPDAIWAHLIYDLIVTARELPDRLDGFVAALVPVYFGRVASAVIENRELSTERAEDSVERQAREFERLKPYLLERWDGANAAGGKPASARPGSARPATGKAASSAAPAAGRNRP